MLSEDDLEQQCLQWFAEQGWDVLHGPDIAPDGDNPLRASFHDVFLRPVMLEQLQTINPHIPVSVLEEVIQHIAHAHSPDLVVSNKAFHHLLLNGVPVEYKHEDKVIHDNALLMDFNHPDNNRFMVVNQVAIQGIKQVRRPDVIGYINGLPVAVIELKSPIDANADIWAAFNQLQTYKNELSDLFICNEALVVSDGQNARIGSLTADEERFLPWKTVTNENDKPQFDWQLKTVVQGFFNRELLLDYIRYFVLFENDGKRLIKKIAAYHQFHAVREAVAATIVASTGKYLPLHSNIHPGSKKAGVVWHTQGSGKSISMCCYAGKLLQQAEMNNPTIVVVTDRNDLDGQLYATFCQAQDLLKQTPLQANDRDELRELLNARESGGIIFTTVQKFAPLDGEQSHPALNQRSNIVVISDEAHRSQYGLSATLDRQTGVYKYGYAKHMRDALPNASFMGFTGTPIASEDKDTRAVFGDYVSIYDIQDAVDDGATVPIYYESRLTKLDLNHEELETLSNQVDELVEDEETGQQEKTKGDWSRLEKLVGSEPRIHQVAADLVQHFETRNTAMNGKAMIVAMSREICVKLYDAIVAIRPEWHSEDVEQGAIKVIMTGSASDKDHLQSHIYNKQTKKRLEARFKDLNDPLKLVIVRDMWLTGFDAPCCHTMYIDKPMRGHNLMQAIARVNRVFRDKPGGLVVDYIGIANELKQALKTYTDSKGKGQTTVDAREAFAILLEKMDVIHGMFARSAGKPGFDYTGFSRDPLAFLRDAVNYILGLDDGKKRYLDVSLAMSKAWSLCNTLDEAEPLQEEFAFLSAIRVGLIKLDPKAKFSQSEKNSLLSKILDNAVVATGVEDVFALAGLDKPNIGLLSDEFLEEVREMPQRNLAVELLEKLLNDGIHARSGNNVVQQKKYSDRLKAVLLKYNNRAIETAQVIEELIEMAKAFQEAMARDDALGLNPDEIAFYDALAENESAVRELGDDTLRKLAIEVTRQLRKSTTVDWQVRDSVRARLRVLVRQTLRKYKYPPDKTAGAVELILKQAEVISNHWTV
ncbi:TPA: type I restriction endonuclease subunit R [Klebsiella variicola]|uniref:type I restriction endonuclease subunit R n=1 Tax=Klebsiella variicola TaxID=244366 RepID=UPI000D74198C|nr:type I restriction endonuclease subunit R [Klebsiella variicola]HBZ7861806.1 type I restriction endonuclease subunit R [Klebsiella variicola subsp. variicola]EKU8624370.1 type I restriction endonuclease subunit R [Klebsiella variicola]MBQ5182263.1 type I restriction endonuclease subunit R [Klebsiella variicola]PXK20139.1 DEAD/DEAH box helicase [Klebsiella variicola]PXK43993.1 DEAD/DEAH box helicase [Klebsiella variicola]